MELQDIEKLALNLTEDLDFEKHLRAKRISEDGESIYYGMYYTEFILVAESLLATAGLFCLFYNKQKTRSENYGTILPRYCVNLYRQRIQKDTIYSSGRFQ